MGVWDAIILGIVQGITEFLPVSSSGHLAVGQYLLGYQSQDYVLFNILLHVGTLGAVVWVYRSSLTDFVSGGSSAVFNAKQSNLSLIERCKQSIPVREMFWIGVATVPTGVVGLLFKKQLESAFGSITMISIMFCVTGVLLLATLWRSGGSRTIAEMTWMHAALIGLAQGIAILPGISRSGATIACALLLGMRRDEAARFSFLLAIPVIGGVALLEIRKLSDFSTLVPFLLGGLTSAIVGYLALRFLIQLVQKGRLAWFAVYLWILAAVLLGKTYLA